MQAALTEAIAPELQTMFAQDVGQVIQMLIESVVSEWDAAADNLHRDNQAMSDLLSRARDELKPIAAGNDRASLLVQEVGRVLGEPPLDSLRISRLSERNGKLREVLEHLLVFLEDIAEAPDAERLMDVRRGAYRHLRKVAVRGWSVFDLLSFRERMAHWRASLELT